MRHDLRFERLGVYRGCRPGPGSGGPVASGTVGHNAFRTDFGMAFGGFKPSGIGREGDREGLLPYLETKSVILEDTPTGYDLGK